eukprot:942247-Prymnesium_polylepis.2
MASRVSRGGSGGPLRSLSMSRTRAICAGPSSSGRRLRPGRSVILCAVRPGVVRPRHALRSAPTNTKQRKFSVTDTNERDGARSNACSAVVCRHKSSLHTRAQSLKMAALTSHRTCSAPSSLALHHTYQRSPHKTRTHNCAPASNPATTLKAQRAPRGSTWSPWRNYGATQSTRRETRGGKCRRPDPRHVCSQEPANSHRDSIPHGMLLGQHGVHSSPLESSRLAHCGRPPTAPPGARSSIRPQGTRRGLRRG